MTDKTSSRLYCAAAAVFLIGSAAALIIFFNAGNAADGGAFDEFLESKRYAHELRVYGGNASVLADQFMRWFTGLWQGETLAYTTAAISTAVSLFLCLVARHSRPGNKKDSMADPAE